MTSLAQALNMALLHFVWQGIAGGLVWGLLRLTLRRRSAESRYIAGCIVLAALALAPMITFGVVYQTAAVPLQASAEGSGSFSTLRVATVSMRGPEALWGKLESWILPLWAAGVLVFMLRLAWAGGHASSLRRHGVKADSAMESMIAGLAERLGVRRKLRVLMSSVAEVPAVVGWLRPVILLPAAVVVGLTPQQLESLLAHELAHIRRHDYFVNILQMIVETFLFYHPVVWWVSSSIRHERELCCDDLAVRSCGDALSYARALAQLERLRVVAPPSLAMGSANGALLHRIQRLVGSGKYEHVPSRLACAAGLLAGFLCLGWFMTAKAQQRDALPPVGELPLLEEVAPIPSPAPTSQSPQRPPSAPVVAAVPAPAAPLAPPPPVQAPALAAPTLPAPPAIAAPTALPVLAVAPTPAASPLLLLQVLQGLSLSQEPPHWVLFKGDSIMARASAAEEEQARKARGTLSGDLLWFQLDGKTFITQDKDVLDRIEAAGKGSTREEEIALAALRELNQLDAQRQVLDAQRKVLEAQRQAIEQPLIRNLQASLEQVSRSLRTGAGEDEVAQQQRNLEAIQVQASNLQVMRAQMDAMNAKREANLRAMENQVAAQRNAEQVSSRETEILRGAVREGKAQIVP